MARRWRRGRRKLDSPVFPLYRLFPNLVTLLALCAGLSSMRFAIQERWEMAVMLIVAAAFLDGIDGRLARLLKATSDFGAQLDSLADFLNFGVAPAIVLYSWGLHELHGIGWSVTLFYSICCAIRLARFNVALDDKDQKIVGEYFFFGIPSPSGAGLALLPLILSFLFADKFDEAPFVITMPMVAAYTLVIALLMVSRLPTFSAKRVRVRREFAPLALAVTGLFVICLLMEPWITLPILGVIYLAGIPLSAVWFYVRFKSRSVKGNIT